MLNCTQIFKEVARNLKKQAQVSTLVLAGCLHGNILNRSKTHYPKRVLSIGNSGDARVQGENDCNGFRRELYVLSHVC